MVQSDRVYERAKSLPPQICVGIRTGLILLDSANLRFFSAWMWDLSRLRECCRSWYIAYSQLLGYGGLVGVCVKQASRRSKQKDVLFMLTDALNQQSFSNNRFVLQLSSRTT
jgi:hypothetical protein